MLRSRIVITMGDPSGIGPEITEKVIRNNSISHKYNLIVVGNRNLLTHSVPDHVKFVEMEEYSETTFPKCIPNNVSGKASMDYIIKAVELIKNNYADALCTCPINKKSIQMAGYKYKGHTDFLADLTGADNYSMMLGCSELKVVLVTAHIPVKDISPTLTKEKIHATILNTHNAGRLFGCFPPKIAITGLNPHAGDSGVIGTEESDLITPAVKQARSRNIDISMPYPADTLFCENNLKKFDFFIAMYHDQGLIPLKMKCFKSAVNVTLNLPIIRTSVDHGTAYEIVGKNKADETSLINAIKTADMMVKNAKTY